MDRNHWRKLASVTVVASLAIAACGGDDESGGGPETSSETAPTGTATAAESATATGSTESSATGGASTGTGAIAGSTDGSTGSGSVLWDNGPCDTSLDPYPIGLTTTFDSPIVSLGDQVDGAAAAIEAFNARGGIGGHCMDFHSCDSQADVNKEVDCAREMVEEGVVATVNDNTTINPQGANEVLLAAGLPRIGISPNSPELASSAVNSFPFTGGGTGAVFAMPPACGRAGHTKVGMITIDSPQVDLLIPPIENILAAYGAELVGHVPIPAGTTDYQQFTLNLQQQGATCIMLPLGEAEAIQVLRAAAQLDADATFAATGASTGLAPVEELGDFAAKILFNGDLPPAAASQERWPALGVLLDDFAASGEQVLQVENLKLSPMRSWVAVYALVRIIEDFGDPDDISREAITAAAQAATDIDMLGLTPRWTPNLSITGDDSPFGRISNPWFYVWSYDPAAGEWVVDDDQVNILAELGGVTDYEQPTS